MATRSVKFVSLLDDASKRFEEAGFETPSLDARLLLQHASCKSHAGLIACKFDLCPTDIIDRFKTFVKRRLKRESVHRIIGEREFHGIPFLLNDATLEPRDDTESLIDLVLKRVEDKNASLTFCDLGTGTGAIAITLMHELPNSSAEMIDVSADALVAASANAEAQGFAPSRWNAFQQDWLGDEKDGFYDSRFHFIVSNPPYIPSQDVDNLALEVRAHDPRPALDGGVDGLDAYRIILRQAPFYLRRGGFVALEIGYDQLQAVCEIGEGFGWAMTDHLKDLSGNDRAVLFERSKTRPHLGFGLDKPIGSSSESG